MSVIQLKSPRRQPLPLPKSAIAVMDAFGLSGPTLADQLFFTLTRRKRGTEIILKMGRLSWSLSYMTGVYPKSFADAREWVASYGQRYGHDISEVKRRPR